MAAPRHAKPKAHPRESAPEQALPGKVSNVLNRLYEVAANERFNVTEAQMEQAFDAARAQVSRLYAQE